MTNNVRKCPHCNKCFIDNDNITCPFCERSLNELPDIFNQIFGENIKTFNPMDNNNERL